MTKEVIAKIFDPFFTTKEVGKGTGLGLSTVFGIVKQHKGYIKAYSEPNIGTTFKIFIPLISGESETIIKEINITDLNGTETILIAEDNNEARITSTTILKQMGYTVIPAIDGQDAIDKFRDHQREIDLCLIDIVMPKKNGAEVINEIRQINNNVKVIFISGYTYDIIKMKGIVDYGASFISKPVSPDKFLKKIREVLDDSY
jgi:CheY-like chemotaxis protein